MVAAALDVFTSLTGTVSTPTVVIVQETEFLQWAFVSSDELKFFICESSSFIHFMTSLILSPGARGSDGAYARVY